VKIVQAKIARKHESGVVKQVMENYCGLEFSHQYLGEGRPNSALLVMAK